MCFVSLGMTECGAGGNTGVGNIIFLDVASGSVNMCQDQKDATAGTGISAAEVRDRATFGPSGNFACHMR